MLPSNSATSRTVTPGFEENAGESVAEAVGCGLTFHLPQSFQTKFSFLRHNLRDDIKALGSVLAENCGPCFLARSRMRL